MTKQFQIYGFAHEHYLHGKYVLVVEIDINHPNLSELKHRTVQASIGGRKLEGFSSVLTLSCPCCNRDPERWALTISSADRDKVPIYRYHTIDIVVPDLGGF